MVVLSELTAATQTLHAFTECLRKIPLKELYSKLVPKRQRRRSNGKLSSGDKKVILSSGASIDDVRKTCVLLTSLQLHAFDTRSEYTGFSRQIGTKLRDWAVGQAGRSCYSRAALSSNDSKTW